MPLVSEQGERRPEIGRRRCLALKSVGRCRIVCGGRTVDGVLMKTIDTCASVAEIPVLSQTLSAFKVAPELAAVAG